jgi:hypothetical protein
MDDHPSKKVQILATHCSCSGYHERHAWLTVAVGARWSPLERDSRMIERQVGKMESAQWRRVKTARPSAIVKTQVRYFTGPNKDMSGGAM